MARSRSASIVWRDFTMLMVLGFVVMVLILLQWVNPPGKDEAGAPPPGNVIVEVYWGEGNIDVDTWIMGPDEIRPVGYSNKSGKVFNLLRDDVGRPDTERNYENAYSRGILAGEYIVNVHCFRCDPHYLPIEIEIEISVNDGKPGKSSLRKLLTTTVTLRRNREEKTALRFRLDEDGALVPGSVNSVHRPLRAWKPEN